MLGLELPFIVVICTIIVLRIALAIYVWWSFRRLKKRLRKLEQ